MIFEHPEFADYELLDSGAGEKLERFGEVVLRRPDPQALWQPWRSPREWEAADLSFVRESDRGGRWETGDRAHPAVREERWPVRWPSRRSGCVFLVRPTPFKHVGLFPEQAANWRFVEDARDSLGGDAPKLLNLFGYTGAASVAAARSGYEVTHVDASKLMIHAVRENGEASGLARDAIRVLVDDALAFAKREVRRGSRYHGILLDPPHSGRGPKGEKWRFENGIAPLVDTVRELCEERAFVILSTYAIGFSALSLANLFDRFEGGQVEHGELALPESSSPQRLLPAGFCARWSRGLGRE